MMKNKVQMLGFNDLPNVQKAKKRNKNVSQTSYHIADNVSSKSTNHKTMLCF